MTDVFKEKPANGDATPTADAGEQKSDQTVFDFIGEGKKYATPEVALASIPHKDSHIATLEAENAALREKLANAKAIDDVLSALKPAEQSTNTVTNTPPANQLEDISETVRSVLQQEEQQRIAEQNVRAVNEQLVKLFGDKANEEAAKKAAELRIDMQTLQSLAERSPEACMALFGQKGGTTEAQGEAHTHSSDTNTQALSEAASIEQGTKAYYDNLRRTDKKAFLSGPVQIQMMKDAEANPEKFFGTAP